MKAFPLPRPTTDADRDALGSQNQSLSSGEAFQFCLDAIPGAVFQIVTSLEGLVVDYPYIGAGCYKLLEISKSAIASPRLLDTIHAEDSAQFELALARAVKSLHLWSWEGRILLANGKIKWISLKVQPVSSQSIKCQTNKCQINKRQTNKCQTKHQADAEETPEPLTLMWTVLAQDITAYKQSELASKQTIHFLSDRLEARTAELAMSQTRLQRLADNVPDVLYEMRLDSQSVVSFPYFSSASHRLLNMPPEQFQQRGASVIEWVHPDEREGLKAAVRASALTMKVCRYDCRFRLPSGKQKWLRTIAKPQPQADGSIIWYGCLSDVSDRKETEAQLSHSLKEVADVRFALDCSSIVVTTDHRGRITYVNDRFCEISKYCRAELIGQTHRLVNAQHHDPAFFREMWQTIASGKVWHGEVKNRAKTGEYYWLETTIVPFVDAAGCPYQYVAIRNDITERKRAAMKLRHQAEDLTQALTELKQAQSRLIQSEKMSSLGQLVAGVAHEINNPVSFIYGNIKPANRYAASLIELLRLYQAHLSEPPEEILETLEDLDFEFMAEDLLNLLSSMKMGAERIRQIVSSLRTFSRKDEAEQKSVDIHQGLDSTLLILGNRLKAEAHRPAIRIVKDYADLPPIDCYAGQLNQVFMNILGNAVDALAGTENPEIRISTALVDKQVEIVLSDNGEGISEDVRSRIFDPFFTTKPIGEGTGMGLSISYQIVTERHGGLISCESTPGEGTTFTIQIPQRQSN
ncbi:MAG: PAS domain-containing protein [Phormidesmis sp.]